MLKYIKKTYMMGIVNYNIESGGGRSQEDINKQKALKEIADKTSFDEKTKEMLEIQKQLLGMKDGPEKTKKLQMLNTLIEERKQEREKLENNLLLNKELVREFINKELQNYSQELNQYQNIRIARQEAMQKRQEKIAEINKKVKEYNQEQLKKAEYLVGYANGNQDFRQKGLSLKIEDGTVALYDKNNKKLKYFTIPTMNPDGTINNEENLNRLENIKVGFEDFVRRYVDVKTYAEVGQENTEKQKQQEKIAALNESIKQHNIPIVKRFSP